MRFTCVMDLPSPPGRGAGGEGMRTRMMIATASAAPAYPQLAKLGLQLPTRDQQPADGYRQAEAARPGAAGIAEEHAIAHFG